MIQRPHWDVGSIGFHRLRLKISKRIFNPFRERSHSPGMRLSQHSARSRQSSTLRPRATRPSRSHFIQLEMTQSRCVSGRRLHYEIDAICLSPKWGRWWPAVENLFHACSMGPDQSSDALYHISLFMRIVFRITHRRKRNHTHRVTLFHQPVLQKRVCRIHVCPARICAFSGFTNFISAPSATLLSHSTGILCTWSLDRIDRRGHKDMNSPDASRERIHVIQG